MAAAACLAGRIGVARTLSVAADRAAASLSLRDDHPARYPGRLAFGGVLVERNALASAADVLDDLAVVTTRTGWRGFAVLARTELARVRAGQSRVDAARAQLRHARATDDGRPLSPELISRIDAAGARVLVDRGDVRAARRLVDRLPPCPETTLLQARVALGSGDPARAADLVDTVATSRVVPRLRVQAGCLAARVAAVADPSEGAARLRDALDLPHAGEMHRVFADEGPWVAETLRAASHPVAHAIASNLPRPDGDAHVRLSDRERVILEYLPTRLSNQDIAAELYVSLNTVKTHLKNIYRKLDATTRNEAVAHAAAGGLLDAPDGTFTSDV
jgi:LuxR family maltose regulon positive regulatory protein